MWVKKSVKHDNYVLNIRYIFENDSIFFLTEIKKGGKLHKQEI